MTSEEMEKAILSEIDADPEAFSDAPICTIDPNTRVITVPASLSVFGTESDEKTNRIPFRCPRVVGDNVDLSNFQICVNFRNANSEKDRYIVEDMMIDGDEITFSWSLSRKVTKYKGKVSFIVCALNAREGTIVNEWNTTLAFGTVLEGLEADEVNPDEEEKDIILQLLAMVDAKSNKALEEIEAAKNEAVKEVQSYGGVLVDQNLENEGQAADAKVTGDKIAQLRGELANIEKPTDEQISTAVREYLLENPPDTGASIDDNSVSQDSTWSSQKIASELNKIEHTLTISLNAIDGGDIYTTVIIENTTTGEIVETLDYNNEILYVVLPKYFGYRVTIGDVDRYVKPNVNVFTGVMNHDMTISATYKFGVIYGYHVNNNESDPASAVTYIENAVGFTPAKMNYSTDAFEYGSWENAFFMPKPCMLKRDGTVDYYLDANNYALKENGESSDIDNEDYDGNAMMEWGQNGEKIYYKMANDEDGNGYSVYISNYKANEDYHCWPFINNQGKLVDHFYTYIYNGSLDSNNCLRSLSGKAYMMSKNAVEEISYAKANNLTSDMLWYTEVYCDIILINSLLVLMGKSLNTQDVYGQGHTSGGSEDVLKEERTGTMNDKGMFYGTNDTTHHVKVFGMENWWGCQWRRFGGLMQSNYKYYYKLTNGTQDGSTATTYGTTTIGMIESEMSAPTSNGYQKKRAVENGVAILPSEVGGSDSTYYCDYYWISSSETYARRGGGSNDGSYYGAFSLNLYTGAGDARWHIGAALSCKPLAR